MSDLIDLSALEMARKVRDRKVSAEELARAHIDRIEAVDGAINAMVVRDFDRALKDARAADKAVAGGGALGPLHGVPVSVKESYDMAGFPTTAGQPGRRGHGAERDSDAVAALRAAGAVVLGKTNVPLNLADWQSHNEVYGRTLNPWNRDYTPGGSSGGSAAAVAARMAALEIGSDIAGSVRVPAAFCGILGLKTTLGAISERGHGVDNIYVPPPMSVMGPFARTAEDLAAMFEVVSGGADPVNRPFRFDDPAGKAKRVAVWTAAPGAPTQKRVSAALQAFAGRLENAGIGTDQSDTPPIDLVHLHHVFRKLLFSIIGTRIPKEAYDAVAATRGDYAGGERSPAADFANFAPMSFRGFWEALRESHILAAEWNRLFETHDFIVTPVIGASGIRIDEEGATTVRKFTLDGKTIDYHDLDFWLAPASALRLPALSLPLGIDEDGLPLAAQIIGPHCSERRLIAFARQVQAAWATDLKPDLAWAEKETAAS